MPQLTTEQKNVILEISKFKKPIQTLGGWAGTGKTVVVQHLSLAHKEFAVCAYTGKACDVLRRKNIAAQTIHSLIYTPLRDAEGNVEVDTYGNPIFILNPEMQYKGIFIDEASMVPHDIFNDLCSFNIPLVFIGDHGQLEPVNSDFNLMKDPDYKLEKIHRNAGEIAHFCQFIREGKRPAAFQHQYSNKNVTFISKRDIEQYFDDTDQIVCAYNKTRVSINKRYRELKGYPASWPAVGDKIMCLRNDKNSGLFNGMQGIVKEVTKKPKNKITFSTDQCDFKVFFDPDQLNREKYELSYDKDAPHAFDFCPACTVHKAQGSEWDNGLVIEEKCNGWDHSRWCYTAGSRFKNKIRWASE